MNALYDKGADVVVGFTEEIDPNQANDWTKSFMKSIAEGHSVRDAVQTAMEVAKRKWGGDVEINDAVYTVGLTSSAPCL